jgi:hypothetical protein
LNPCPAIAFRTTAPPCHLHPRPAIAVEIAEAGKELEVPWPMRPHA